MDDIKELEARLTAGLHALVDDQDPSPELRERIVADLGTAPSSRRRWIPAAAAALLLVAGIGVVAGLGGDDDGGQVDLATDPSPAVLDDRTDRDDEDEDDADPSSDTDTSTSTTTSVVDAAETELGTETETDEPAEPADADAPPPAPPAPTAPPTTALVCQNSTNPACGPFRWEPTPVNRPATLELSVPDEPITVGETTLTMIMSDPDGAVSFDCYDISHDGGGSIQISGPCSVTFQECPDRFGPWSPPPPRPHRMTNEISLEFPEPGTYTIWADVQPADGCDNVDPYRSGASAERTITVVE